MNTERFHYRFNMAIRTRSWQYFLVFSIALGLLVVATNHFSSGRAQVVVPVCPSPTPNNIDNQPYRFQYDSVRAKAQSDTTLIVRCLRNLAPIAMKFTWEKIPLEGWLQRAGTRGAVAQHSISVFDTEDVAFLDSTLWYGISQRRTVAPFMTRKKGVVTGGTNAPKTLETKAILSVPIDEKNLESGFVLLEFRFFSSAFLGNRSVFDYGSSVRVLEGPPNFAVMAKLNLTDALRADRVFFGESFGSLLSLDKKNQTVDASALNLTWQPQNALSIKSNVVSASIDFVNRDEKRVGGTSIDLYVPVR